MTLTERKIAIADAVIASYLTDSKSSLPPAIVSLVSDYNDALREEEANRMLEEELRRKEDEKRRKKKEEELKKKYDAIANPVPWADKVPLNERFVVMKKRSKYYQCQKLCERDDYCPVDLLRGYTAPYFGYYGNGLRHCVIETMSELFKREGIDLWKFVSSEFNFFKLSGNALDDKMSAVSYTVGDDGSVKELYVGPPMTYYEHFKALEAKYGTNESDGIKKEDC